MWQYNHTPESNELMHYGVLGMKWGKRRYQNKDGSLTAAGKKRYDTETEANLAEKKATKEENGGWSTKKKVAVAGAAIAGTTLAAYGAKKLHDYVRTENFRIRENEGLAVANKIFKESTDSVRNSHPLVKGSVHDTAYKVRQGIIKNYRDAASRDSFGVALKNVVGKALYKSYK